MVPPSLEDNFEDILQKARDGLGLSMKALSEQSGVTPPMLKALFHGDYDKTSLTAVAPLLQLDAESLVDIAEGAWSPQVHTPEGLWQITSPFGKGMTVHAYLLKIPNSSEALLFDTGTSLEAIKAILDKHKLLIAAIFLTHTHSDHIAILKDLLEAYSKPPVYVQANEALRGAQVFKEGDSFTYPPLTVETRLTSGHSPGGTTYIVHTEEASIAIVGDALFAGSMGRGFISHKEALRNNMEHIMTLPDTTILCPGHGPITSVAEEKAHNPFICGAS